MDEKPPSLRRQLIMSMASMMLPLFLLLWAVAYFSGSYFINAAFDRSLVRRTYALADRVEVLHGRVRVDLPVAARELLAFDQEDLLSHSITSPEGRVVEGGLDMPPLPGERRIQPGQLIIYDGKKDGEKVRVAAFALSLQGTSAKGVALIKVSETLTRRSALTGRATLAIVIPMLLMTLAAAAAITYGVGRGLDPVRRLRDRLLERPALDLSPVPFAGTPAELRPFLDEINWLISDNGPGIPVHQREAVLAPFHRLLSSIEGAGIGLTIVARIVHLHRARLSLESNLSGTGLLVRIAFSPVLA